MTDASRPPRQLTATSVSLIAGAALLAGLLVGLLLPAVAPTLAGLGLGESCADVQNELHALRGELRLVDDGDVEGPAAELFELAERRPDCLGDHDRDLTEGFRTFLDQDG